MGEEETSANFPEAVTEDMRVGVNARYAAEHSDPTNGNWFFIYTVLVTNEGSETVRLESRHWVISDGMGKVEEVRGDGVVGEQPEIGPGESFEYTSGCPLTTPFGSMRGTYRMVRADGSSFEAQIPAFELSEPHALH